MHTPAGPRSSLALVPAAPQRDWRASYDGASALTLHEQRLALAARNQQVKVGKKMATLKRPMSAFEHFSEVFYGPDGEREQEDNADRDREQDSAEAAWAVLSLEEQQMYAQIEETDRIRYEKELNQMHGVDGDGMFSLIMLAGKRRKRAEDGDEKGAKTGAGGGAAASSSDNTGGGLFDDMAAAGEGGADLFGGFFYENAAGRYEIC